MGNSLLFYLHAISSLHMGTGVSTGLVDLPHSREVSTGLPNAPGSGVKGVLRDELMGTANHAVLFGAEHDNTGNRDQAALLVSDAQILCFPVVSYAGDFAWVTSPLALARYARERRFCFPNEELPAIPVPPADTVWHATSTAVSQGNKAYLRDVVLSAAASSDVGVWAGAIATDLFGPEKGVANAFAWHAEFVKRFVVASDADFLMFTESGSDVRTRNRLDDNKQVADGQLWSEECMPAESIFWGTVAADAIFLAKDTKGNPADARDEATAKTWIGQFKMALGGLNSKGERTIQFGGKASVGRGQTRFVLAGT